MCPQFVDFDGDDYTDIITATYEGCAFIVRGSAAGWQQPEHLLDADGNHIKLSVYWDNEENRWSQGDGEVMNAYQPAAHCVSAAAFDWDADGDFDLLLGSYDGPVFLRRNEGTHAEPKFATENEQIEAGGKPFVHKGGMTAPRLVDWDGDGLTDIVCGGFKGGVYLYRNAGAAGAPEFEKAVALIEPGTIDPDGQKFPTSGCYVDPVDYDNDGDLDLLVGGYAEWMPKARDLTDADHARLAELREELQVKQQAMQESLTEYQAAIAEATTDEERQEASKLLETSGYQQAYQAWRDVYDQINELQPMNSMREAGVWLYRRK